MRSWCRALTVQLVLTFLASTGAASAQTPSSPAPPLNPFVGTWVLNVAKSTYEGQQRKKLSTRTLDTYEKGIIVATHRRVNEDGNEGFSYWVGNLEGREFEEFARQRPNTRGNMVSIKVAEPRKWNVTFRNQAGHIVLTDTWTVSADGKTLTIDRRGSPPKGKPSHSVEVYESDGFAAPRARQ
jgi:hypothetical protein